MEEFDLASSENSNSSDEPQRKNLWMCGASKASVVTDGSEWCKDVMDKAYVPIPYPEEKFEPVEWPHCLATLDVCTLNHGTKFCDEDGYDIIPIRMVAVIENGNVKALPIVKERFHQEEARERRKQIKAHQQAQILAISTQSGNESKEEFVNPFTLHLQLLTTDLDTWTTALIDSGTDCNVLSYETWEKLGKPELIPSTLTFDNFSGSKMLSLGKLCVKALVQEQPMNIVFQIAHEGQATINVVLGQQWIAAHNFQINWATRGYTLHVNSINLRGKSSELENLTS